MYPFVSNIIHFMMSLSSSLWSRGPVACFPPLCVLFRCLNLPYVIYHSNLDGHKGCSHVGVWNMVAMIILVYDFWNIEALISTGYRIVYMELWLYISK